MKQHIISQGSTHANITYSILQAPFCYAAGQVGTETTKAGEKVAPRLRGLRRKTAHQELQENLFCSMLSDLKIKKKRGKYLIPKKENEHGTMKK